jgi:hypothetical protein
MKLTENERKSVTDAVLRVDDAYETLWARCMEYNQVVYRVKDSHDDDEIDALEELNAIFEDRPEIIFASATLVR